MYQIFQISFLFFLLLRLVVCVVKLVLIAYSFWIIQLCGHWVVHWSIFSEHVVRICEHLIQTYEFACRNLLYSNDICRFGAIDYLEVVPRSKVVLEGSCALAS